MNRQPKSNFSLPMVKSYLRFVPEAAFGVITSTNSNALADRSGRYCITPALEDVIVWQWKQGSVVGRWHDPENHKNEVTCIAPSPAEHDEIYAVGYADGSIRLWTLNGHRLLVTFRGHKQAVTALRFDAEGARLISGAKDTDIVLWDVVNEVGLFRLLGHKDQVTSLHLLKSGSHLISTSKDTLIKIWDLSTQHCIETVIGHRNEIWSSILLCDETKLLTGTSSEIRVWDLRKDLLQDKLRPEETETMDVDGDEAFEMSKAKQALKFNAVLPRMSKEKVMGLIAHSKLPYFACHSSDKTVEIFKISNQDELKKKLNRRVKRQQEKKKSTQEGEQEVSLKVTDEFVSTHFIRASAKVRSCDFLMNDRKDGLIQILMSLSNNSIEIYGFYPKAKDYDLSGVLDIPGHRHDVRVVAISSDDQMILTASQGAIKIWNPLTHQCTRTMHCDGDFPVCASFVPGNRYVLVGQKSGDLDIYDIWSSVLVERIKAHEGTLWSIDVRPDKKGFITGGADKDVKFWDFGAVEEESTSTRRLTALHMRTLRMPDEVLCVKHTPNQRLVAVALLDATVKVFFHDTLKFFLSLYGHKVSHLYF